MLYFHTLFSLPFIDVHVYQYNVTNPISINLPMKSPDKSPQVKNIYLWKSLPGKSLWHKQHLLMKAPDKVPQGKKHLPMKVPMVKISTHESPSLKLQGKKHLPMKVQDKSP